MFVHKIALAASENQSKYATVYRKSRITMLMKVLQTGQVPPPAATLFAQFSQNRAWPHGTRAKPSRGATRQTSQHSGSVAVVAKAELAAGVAVVSCVASSLLSLSSAGCSEHAVCAAVTRLLNLTL